MSVSFNDKGTMLEIAGLPIKSVPFAQQAAQIGGYGLENLVKISGASNVTFTPAQVQTLKGMLGGAIDWDLQARKLTNVADPVSNGDAATKGWVVSQLSAFGSGTVSSVSGTGVVSVANGTSTPTISVSQANGTTSGYVSSTDWNTFNSKQAAGNYVTALTGDVVASGPGSAAATIQANAVTTAKIADANVTTVKINDKAVTYAKIQDVTSGKLLGRATAGAGVTEEITLGSGLSFTGTTLNTVNSGTVTSVASTNAYLTVASGTTTPQITANVGTAANTLAAGNDSRITGALQKSGGTMTGAIDMGGQDLNNAGHVSLAASKNLQLGTYGTDPSTAGWTAADKGKTWFNTTSNQVKYWDGSAVQAVGISGAGLTSLGGQSGSTQTFAAGATGTAPAISSSGNVHTLNVPLASGAGVTSGTISKTEYDTFNNKVGTSYALAGDVTGTPAATVVDRIKGKSVSAAPTAAGQVLRYTGTQFDPAFISMFDLRSTITGAQSFGGIGCTSGQTLTWTAATDNLSCTNIAITNTQVSGLGSLATKSAVDLSTADATGTLAAARFPALTGDVATTAGALATTIQANAVTTSKVTDKAVTYAKIQDVTSGKLLGRATAGAGVTEEITLGAGLSFTGTTLNTVNGGTVTNVTSANADISVANGTTTPSLTLNAGATGGAGDANKIAKLDASGLLATAMIPNHSATKITSGTLALARGGTGVSPTGVVGDANKVFGLDSTGAAGEMKSFVQGSGVSIAHAAGTITISATGSGGTVTNVTGTAPVTVTSGSTTPTISMAAATTSVNGYLSSTDWNTFNGKAPLASPAFTGTPTAPTAAVNTNSTQLATTAFVLAQASSSAPLIDGTAAAGTGTTFSRADHVHPTDTSRAPAAGSASITTLGTITTGTWTGTTIAVANGGTGTTSGSITGTSALTFTAGGTNQNVTLTPSGTGYTLLNGNVGIGTASPGQKLEVNGSVKAVSFIATSDRRLKKNIRTVDGLSKILKLRGVSFDWISNGTPEVGLIAQEVEQVFPEMVVTDPRTTYKAVKYQSLVAPLIESTKELYGLCQDASARSEAQEFRIQELERHNQELELRLQAIEAKLGLLPTR